MSETLPSQQEVKDANQVRKSLYRWFADLFSQELTTQMVRNWSKEYVNTHQVFKVLGLESASKRLQQAIEQLQALPEQDRRLELAADFAHMFLLSGKESAPPYASYYLDSDQMLFGKPAEQMRLFLQEHQLALNPNFKEPEDHLSVHLHFMAIWLANNIDQNEKHSENDKESQHKNDSERQDLLDLQEQAQFLEDTLLTWLPAFNERCQKIVVKTDVYPALVNLLTQFVKTDVSYISES